MTTRWAARSVTPKRWFLGVVVPVLYLLALYVAVVLASHGSGHRAPATIRLLGTAVRPTVHPHAHETHRSEAVSRPPLQRQQRRAVSRPAPVAVAPAIEPAVSRSEERTAMVEAPPVGLVIQIAAVTGPSTMQSMINRCVGPVEIVWGWVPTEIAEHDYCGGSAFSSLATGERVQVIGGDLSGIYVVNGQRRFAAAGSSAEQLDGIGDIALQTCVSDGVVLVGLDRVA